ncbi:MAG: hypothetical protein LBH46_00595, partial [Rickettsiales bacterium]|nr:hypothetical protein [Rickettsiales bacterium]
MEDLTKPAATAPAPDPIVAPAPAPTAPAPKQPAKSKSKQPASQPVLPEKLVKADAAFNAMFDGGLEVLRTSSAVAGVAYRDITKERVVIGNKPELKTASSGKFEDESKKEVSEDKRRSKISITRYETTSTISNDIRITNRLSFVIPLTGVDFHLIKQEPRESGKAVPAVDPTLRIVVFDSGELSIGCMEGDSAFSRSEDRHSSCACDPEEFATILRELKKVNRIEQID